MKGCPYGSALLSQAHCDGNLVARKGCWKHWLGPLCIRSLQRPASKGCRLSTLSTQPNRSILTSRSIHRIHTVQPPKPPKPYTPPTPLKPSKPSAPTFKSSPLSHSHHHHCQARPSSNPNQTEQNHTSPHQTSLTDISKVPRDNPFVREVLEIDGILAAFLICFVVFVPWPSTTVCVCMCG